MSKRITTPCPPFTILQPTTSILPKHTGLRRIVLYIYMTHHPFVMTHHRSMSELGTTLLWKHMGKLMGRRKMFSFPGSVANAYLKDNHLVLNGKRLHNIDKNMTTVLPYDLHKLGYAMIEYDRETNMSCVYTDDDEYLLQGHAYPNVNKISLGYDEHYYDTMEIADDYLYDPKLDRYILTYAQGFSIITKSTHAMSLTPEQILVGMDRGTLEDCYFQCDSQMFAFSETMRYVAYIYKNTLYFGETTHPFRLYTSEKLKMNNIVSISMTGMSPVVTHDTNKVTIFNYIRK